MWGSKEGEEHSQGCCMCPLLSPSCSGCPAWQGGSVPCRCPYPFALLNVRGGVCVCVSPIAFPRIQRHLLVILQCPILLKYHENPAGSG